jgi:hypothetical protein
MGDLNVEPYALRGIPTSRYREVVQKHHARHRCDVLFYNASWRWLGEKRCWRDDKRPPSLAGTYRHADRTPSAWRTFDQVLVSPSLLGHRGWIVREDLLGIWAHKAVFDPHRSRPRRPFDHLPLLGELEWVAGTP